MHSGTCCTAVIWVETIEAGGTWLSLRLALWLLA